MIDGRPNVNLHVRPELAFDRTADDTIVVNARSPEPIDLVARSTVLRELFPDGVCAVEEFAIQTTQFSDPTMFVKVTIDDTVYGPFGGPWMVSRGASSVQTPGPRARRGQRMRMEAYFRGINVPTEAEVHLRCLVRTHAPEAPKELP